MKQTYFLLFLYSILPILSQDLQHECGLALIRLFKPLHYYREKYHDPAWGTHQLCLLMEKQRNRGQDSVGFSAMQYDMPPGHSFMKRYRSSKKNALEHLFAHINQKISEVEHIAQDVDDLTLKEYCPFIGEVYLGHLRYATHGGNNKKFSQPYQYKNGIPAKSLMLAGNFNMTNSPEIMKCIISYGLAPSNNADTHLLIHQMSYWLDKAYEHALDEALKTASSQTDASAIASKNIDIAWAIRQAATCWDGGYVLSGILGNGDAFICRDPAGIRPGYYYIDEEIFAAASERSALMNTFNLVPEQVHEIPRAHIIIIKKNGTIETHQFTDEITERQCVFERFYFSRPCDPDIYQERKALGINLANRLFQELNNDLSTTVFSYIPNTSEISFHGLIEELNQVAIKHRYNHLIQSGVKELTNQDILTILDSKTRVEKMIFKDQVIRTFIANDAIRADLVSKVYDVTRGVMTEHDTLVALDDSIVRGTTLRHSIIKRLIELNPGKIIIVSAVPIILYPDCYGIDMSQIGRLIGFQAAIALTKERGNQQLIDNIYDECLSLQEDNSTTMYNPIKRLYDQFSQQELENKIAELIYPHDSSWNKELRVIYQTIDGLHQAIPHHTGDWHFTGNYPTPGGYKVLINSYINWYTAKTGRAY